MNISFASGKWMRAQHSHSMRGTRCTNKINSVFNDMWNHFSSQRERERERKWSASRCESNPFRISNRRMQQTHLKWMCRNFSWALSRSPIFRGNKSQLPLSSTASSSSTTPVFVNDGVWHCNKNIKWQWNWRSTCAVRRSCGLNVNGGCKSYGQIVWNRLKKVDFYSRIRFIKFICWNFRVSMRALWPSVQCGGCGVFVNG